MSEPANVELIAFLRARLDEDERAARQAPGPSWEHRQIKGTFDESVVFEDYIAVADPDRNTVVLSDVEANVLQFALRFGPARVLAEVEAKRRMLRLHRECDARCYMLQLLALPYSGHEHYCAEWHPTG